MKVIFLIVFSICMVHCVSSNFEKGDLPSFNLLMLDSTTLLNTSNVPEGKPIMFIFFSPDCDHCQMQVEDLIQHMNLLKTVRLYFISFDSLDRLKSFNEHYKLSNYTNVIIGRDYKLSFPSFFQIPTVPFILIYNKHKQLQIILKGVFETDQIMEEMDKF